MSERGDEFQLYPGYFQSVGNEPGHGLAIHWPASTFTVSESRMDIHRRLNQMDYFDDAKNIIRAQADKQMLSIVLLEAVERRADIKTLTLQLRMEKEKTRQLKNSLTDEKCINKKLRKQVGGYISEKIERSQVVERLRRELDQANHDANKYQNMLSAADDDLDELRAEKIAS